MRLTPPPGRCGNRICEMKTTNLHNQLVEWRHDFHMNPEIGFEENRTSARIAQLLNEFGLKVHQGIGKTGVVGILKKGSSNKSIALPKSPNHVSVSSDAFHFQIPTKNSFRKRL